MSAGYIGVWRIWIDFKIYLVESKPERDLVGKHFESVITSE